MPKATPQKFEEVYWPGIRQPRGFVDERCRFEQIDGGRPCPAFRLTIDEAWTDGTPIARVTATTYVDDGGQRFVAAHPSWSKDPRPFILWQIYEALWRTKLMEAGEGSPKTFEVFMQDSAREAITLVRLTAEVFYHGGGVALAMLVNYANRHIYDQLDAVYASNPVARPSVARLIETKDQFYRDRANQELVQKREQELALRAKPARGADATLYIDESGDLGFRTSSHHYISCGVLIPDTRATAARSALKRILEKNWTETRPSELHFNQLAEPRRAAIASAMSEAFLHHAHRGICYASPNISFCRYLLRCEAEQNRLLEKPIQSNIADLLSDPEAHPGRKLLILTSEEMISHIGIDCLISGGNLSVVHDRKHRPWMNEALQKGFVRSGDSIRAISAQLYGRELCPAMSFATTASESEPCLWFADWIAWEVGAWLRGEKFSKGFNRVRDRIRFIGFGPRGEKQEVAHPGGPIIGTFPDRPREIRSIL